MRGAQVAMRLLPYAGRLCSYVAVALLSLLLSGLVMTRGVSAMGITVEDMLDGLDFEQVDDTVDGLNFKGLVLDAVSGGDVFGTNGLLGAAAALVGSEIRSRGLELLKLASIGIMSAVFANASASLRCGQAAVMGRLTGNVLMVTVLAASYAATRQVATEVLEGITAFLKILMPTYISCMALSGGTLSAAALGEGIMLLCTVIASIFSGVVVGGCNVYVVLAACDAFVEDGRLGQLGALLMKGLRLVLKASMGVVAGLNLVKGMIAPLADGLQSSLLVRAVKLIPGIGDGAGAVSGTLLGTGALIRNGIGVAALVVIAGMCAVPVVRLSVYVGAYRLVGAMLAPMAGKETCRIIDSFVEAMKLMLLLVVDGAIVIFVVIAIMCMTTNSAYYGG